MNEDLTDRLDSKLGKYFPTIYFKTANVYQSGKYPDSY
jgi:hypothetical protein